MSLPQIDLAQARAIQTALRAIVDALEANPNGVAGLWVYPDRIDANVSIGPRVPPMLITTQIEQPAHGQLEARA